ncbi:MAG: HAD-IA family hydrolase [Rhodospirillales bacterium]|nr:HAD-IA family hydrolase [Rhodospirillales bacterium]
MSSASRLKLAIFDCDGTLVDSQHAIVACMHAAFSAQNLAPPTAEEVKRVIGLSLAECMARLAPGEADARHVRLTESYKEAFFTLRQRPDHYEPLFDGAVAALDTLEAAGYLLGVATGKARRGLLAVLDRHGLAGRFVTLQTSDTGPGKPHPAMLERALAETGAAAADTVMIGDTSFDMLMARAANVYAIGVGWGYHPAAELSMAGAHALVERFPELPDAVTRAERRAACA